MLSLEKGKMVAIVKGGSDNGTIIHLDDQQKRKKGKTQIKGTTSIKLDERDDGIILPIPNVEEREVVYIAGPSGSGKSTYAANYIKYFNKVFPKAEIFIFSRTDSKDDPAFKGIKINQVLIDESLVEDPIDITQEIPTGSLLLFDDVNTIQNKQVKNAVDNLMEDIMEVGRKLELWVVITNHLVIPNEKKMARTVLNECQSITVFPKSGSVQQIRYALNKYFGYSNKQINKFLETDSRWITFKKTYPQLIINEYEIYIPS